MNTESPAGPEPFSGPVDLTNCDREPIQIPGSIQPHGILLALCEPDLRIVATSANAEAGFGRPAADLLNQALDGLLSADDLETIRATLGKHDLPPGGTLIDLQWRGFGDGGCDGVLHRHEGLVILEIEPRGGQTSTPSRHLFRRVRNSVARLQSARQIDDACAIAAREVRRITGFDRVMTYRFAPDWSGEVLGEDCAPEMPSFLGLHFPASDIPAQARDLYARNLMRIIPDVRYQPIALVPNLNPRTGRPIDLSYSRLRSVSPIHLEYLTNMGVGAAMSVSILREERLWGLIACHHPGPHLINHDIRQAAEMIGQVLAWQLGVIEETAAITRGALFSKIRGRLLEDMYGGQDHRDGVVRNSGALLDLVQATGMALVTGDVVTLIGVTPSESEVMALADWLARLPRERLFQTDQLSLLWPETASYAAVASGLLAIPLSNRQRNLMLWFRPEIAQTVTWCGDPSKPVTLGPNGERLQPRKSFEAWTQEVKGHARPWDLSALTAASEIRDLVIDVILQRTQELELTNRQLARSNEELESFAYIASHDLREPLRQIETFTGLLTHLIPKGIADDHENREFIEGIKASSRRLRCLISDLAEYSRIGSRSQPLEPEDLNELMREVTFDLREQIRAAGVTVSVASLPKIRCDRTQIRQLLQNLLSNAIKYRHPTRPPEVQIRAALENDGAAGAVRSLLRLDIIDNGIGFDPKYKDKIFEPFQRLHTSERYEGTGIGLAICRKIVDRHGGTISAWGRPDQGSTFSVTLPVRTGELTIE